MKKCPQDPRREELDGGVVEKKDSKRERNRGLYRYFGSRHVSQIHFVNCVNLVKLSKESILKRDR